VAKACEASRPAAHPHPADAPPGVAAGDTSPLVAALGDMLRAVLLKARDDGVSPAAQAQRATGVEEQEGSYGWPAYESRRTQPGRTRPCTGPGPQVGPL
jgi:hypothetical protein